MISNKTFKSIVGTFILGTIIFICIVATQSVFFKPLVKYIMEIRGTENLTGEEHGLETLSISFKIILPIVYIISFGIIYKTMSRLNIGCRS
jgi:riboflavin transporter FmnP